MNHTNPIDSIPADLFEDAKQTRDLMKRDIFIQKRGGGYKASSILSHGWELIYTVRYCQPAAATIRKIEVLHAEMVKAQENCKLAEELYDELNLSLSPFKVGGRIMYRGKEYQIDRVNSDRDCTTNCLAFPIKKDGTMGVVNPVCIYSNPKSDLDVYKWEIVNPQA